ncbi:MAG: hypothetical protein ACREC6_13185, partial [Hyphomicrobiaceae bacterium]
MRSREIVFSVPRTCYNNEGKVAAGDRARNLGTDIKIMARQGGTALTGRDVVQKFAAHIAHLLNTGSELNTGQLYFDLLKTLSGGGEYGAQGNPYVTKLVALHLLGSGITAGQAAASYFERVLDRRLALAAGRQHHKGHAVHLALCRRGMDDRWEAAYLDRSKVPVSTTGLDDLPSDFAAVCGKISECCADHQGRKPLPGNPALATRTEYGPLYLKLRAGAAEVAEELSVWEAIRCAPGLLRVLSRPDFNKFCSLMIQAVETANKHYGILVGLRLSPHDYPDVSIHTLKKISAFVSEVRAKADKSGSEPNALKLWEEVWANPKRRVPGFDSAQEFRESEMGRRLRNSGVLGLPAEPEPEPDPDMESDDDDANLNGAADFKEAVRSLLKEGLLDWYGAWLLDQLGRGRKLHRLTRSP